MFSKVKIFYSLTFPKNNFFCQVIDKKLEKLYEQVNHLENPLTPNQVILLKKVVSKFKSKVKTSIEEGSEGRSPMLGSVSRGSSPKATLHPLAIPSPTAQGGKPKATWGRFLRKTSEQMLGIQQQAKVRIILITIFYFYKTLPGSSRSSRNINE